ncbi:MAG: hypothetical protein WB420_20700, partial [Bradyrhizobium sp.]
QQLDRVPNAGCAGVAESRGFHRCDLPGRVVAYFFELDGGACQRSSLFIERLFLMTRLSD